MADRSFPVVYATDVEDTAAFYERLGFERHMQMPPEGPAGYVALRRSAGEVAVVDQIWSRDQFGQDLGRGPRFEIFVYVDDVDVAVGAHHQRGGKVLRPAEDMPWGERVGYIADPDGNPVALAAPLAG
jgi:lactoylglutathione lyase